MKTLIWICATLLVLVTAPVRGADTQRTFATPEEAVESLVAAARAGDRKGIVDILGPGSGNDLSSGDAVADRATREQFVASYAQRKEITKEGDRAYLSIGADAFPFAFPLVRKGDRWRFDTAAGREELLARRIGENELTAIDVLRAIVDAQVEYASEDRNGNGVYEYATKFASTPGKRDGLYWRVKAGEPPSPLGELVASASSEGYAKQKGPVPYHGYYYRLLRGQGPDAATGRVDYVVRGRAIGGFAVVAWPAKYGNSGVMTFIVNHEGTVFERDLGAGTSATVAAMQRFNPGSGWSRVPTR